MLNGFAAQFGNIYSHRITINWVWTWTKQGYLIYHWQKHVAEKIITFRCDSFISLCIRVIHTVTKRLQTYCVKVGFCNNDKIWNQKSSKSTRNFWMVAEINICTLWYIIPVHKFTKPQCIKAFTSSMSCIYNSTLN